MAGVPVVSDTRSLRSLPVAQSYRDQNEAAESTDRDAGDGDGASPEPDFLEGTLEAGLASFEQSVAALEDEIEAGLAAGEPPSGLQGTLAPRTASGSPGTAEPARSVLPVDPPGWERIP